MLFDSTILLRCLVIPAAISAVGSLILSLSPSSEYWDDDEPLRGQFWTNLFGSLLCGAAIVIPDLWGRDLLLRPDTWREWRANEPWMWLVWFGPASILLFALMKAVVRVPARFSVLAWPVTATIGAGLLYVALPQSNGYEDKLPLAVAWLGIGTVATLWNAMAVSSIATSRCSRWNMLVLLAQAGCVAVLALQAYASLGLWGLTLVGVCAGASVVGLFRGSTAVQYGGWQLAPLGIAMTAVCVANIATTEFYVSEPQPRWLIGLILFLPTIVGAVDFVFRRAGVIPRAVIAAVTSGIILGVEIYWFQLNTPEW